MNHKLSSRIIAALAAFEAEAKREADEPATEIFGWKYFSCSNCCQWLKENCFPEARIMGYFNEENESAEMGIEIGGHDFLVLQADGEEYIIDFWPRVIMGKQDAEIVIEMKKTDLVQKYYGNKYTWSEVKL